MGQGRNWTREEYDTLAELWGVYSLGTIAKRMNRSENAILIKVQRMGLGSHTSNSHMITLSSLLESFDYSYSGYAPKFEAAGLKIHKQRVRNCSVKMVDIDEFWEFAEKNRHLFDFSRFEEYTLGAEPEWVKEKRAEGFRKKWAVKPHNTPWTEAEDKELLRLLREYRYTYPEIAARLHRTEGAIQRRVTDLKIRERPLKADNHILWMDEEYATLGRMIKAGSNYESMSAVLGKSVKAIRGRVYGMYLTENLNKVAKIIGEGEWGDNRPDRPLSKWNTMNTEERKQVKEELSTLAGLLAYKLRQHYADGDFWQRHVCQHWDKVKGCTKGGIDCDECDSFLRIKPQYCARCGATFYERKENRICERCRTQRKKQAARKYMRMKEREKNEMPV